MSVIYMKSLGTKSNKLTRNHYQMFISRNSIVRNLYTITKIPVQITKRKSLLFFNFKKPKNYFYFIFIP